VLGTDAGGQIVWDGGVKTPFGVSVSTASALTQPLLFPGQYDDAETFVYEDLMNYAQSGSMRLT
jgi:hypothetical protein